MNYILFEDHSHFDLLPFCYTRPIYALRAGILTTQARWEMALKQTTYTIAYDYLGEKYNKNAIETQQSIWINGKFSPNETFLRLLSEIKPNQAFQNENKEILCFCTENSTEILPFSNGILDINLLENSKIKTETIDLEAIAIRKMHDIFTYNAKLIQYDFELLTNGRKSAGINDKFSAIYGADNIFVEEGVKVRAAIINAENGLVYIGKNVDIQEGAMIHGTHAFCDNSVVNMGAKMRGDSTVGPYSKVGGEIGNSVIMGYSNKGHDGYMGNSVLGYWCNLGADTNTSNLKNTYEKVKIWNYVSKRFSPTGLQFCGLMMGDHSKCGINTMFNTGTVVGVACNVFGDGFPRNFIPDFVWGGAGSMVTHKIEKVLQTAEAVMGRRNIPLDEQERAILMKVMEITKEFRSWE
jgi:UDP-N-acetylglucosamine diphosphorylase/glucosamine-1-phosphate N-acetyltransferase